MLLVCFGTICSSNIYEMHHMRDYLRGEKMCLNYFEPQLAGLHLGLSWKRFLIINTLIDASHVQCAAQGSMGPWYD